VRDGKSSVVAVVSTIRLPFVQELSIRRAYWRCSSFLENLRNMGEQRGGRRLVIDQDI
jgi:hypothetical protein